MIALSLAAFIAPLCVGCLFKHRRREQAKRILDRFAKPYFLVCLVIVPACALITNTYYFFVVTGRHLLSGLLVLGVWYRLEFAQAVLFLAVPMTLVGALSVSAARGIADADPAGAELVRRLVRHRFWTQLVGMAAIFVTAMFGMYHNLAALRAW